jgi:hypothetical protein
MCRRLAGCDSAWNLERAAKERQGNPSWGRGPGQTSQRVESFKAPKWLAQRTTVLCRPLQYPTHFQNMVNWRHKAMIMMFWVLFHVAKFS